LGRHVRLTLRQLQIFGAVAQSGSTTAAAATLALSQSATSAALNELERVLGVPLFDRVGRRLLLNESGRALLPSARALLDGARTVEDGFRLGRAGTRLDLRIAASTTIGNYVLPPLLPGFRTAAPDAQLHVRIGNTLEVATAVESFEADLGLIEGPCHAADLRVIPWLDDELTLVAAPTHPLALAAGQGRLSLRDLEAAGWLLREPGSGTREAVEQALVPHLSHLRPQMTLGSSEAIKNAVALGLGVSCLSKSVVQDFLDAGRLVVLRSTLPRLSRRFSIVHHRQKMLSNALNLLITALQRGGSPAASPP